MAAIVPHSRIGRLASTRNRRIALAAAGILIVLFLALRALPDRVDTAAVARGDVARSLVLTGRVRPPARPNVGATIAGTVRQVLVREGDRVRAGQLLVRLDDAQATAAVAEARAALTTVRADARAEAERAARELRQAERDLARARQLHAAGALSQRDLEEAAQRAGDARATSEAASARAAGGSGSLAQVAQGQAAVDAAEARLALTRLVAPAVGTVVARRVDPGDVVTPGQVLLELALQGPTEIVAFASEESLGELRTGASGLASADAYPGETFPVRVTWIAPAVDPAQGTIEVRLAVPAPPAYLLPDMTVSVDVEVARRARALVVPRTAVRVTGPGAGWVFIARDGRAERRAVQLGVAADSVVEIRGGLAEGDVVLLDDVEPGARVRVAR